MTGSSITSPDIGQRKDGGSWEPADDIGCRFLFPSGVCREGEGGRGRGERKEAGGGEMKRRKGEEGEEAGKVCGGFRRQGGGARGTPNGEDGTSTHL